MTLSLFVVENWLTMENFATTVWEMYNSPDWTEEDFTSFLEENQEKVDSSAFLSEIGETRTSEGRMSEFLVNLAPFLSEETRILPVFPGKRTFYHRFFADYEFYRQLAQDFCLEHLTRPDEKGKTFFHYLTKEIDLESSTLRCWSDFFTSTEDLRTQTLLDQEGYSPLDYLRENIRKTTVSTQKVYRDNTEPLASQEKNLLPVEDFYRILYQTLTKQTSSSLWISCKLLIQRPLGNSKTFSSLFSIDWKTAAVGSFTRLLSYLRRYSLPEPWCRSHLVSWTIAWYHSIEMNEKNDEILGILLSQFPSGWVSQSETAKTFLRLLLKESFSWYWTPQGLWITLDNQPHSKITDYEYRGNPWVFSLLYKASPQTLRLLAPHYQELDPQFQDRIGRNFVHYLLYSKQPAGWLLRPEHLHLFEETDEEGETPLARIENYVDHYALIDVLRIMA